MCGKTMLSPFEKMITDIEIGNKLNRDFYKQNQIMESNIRFFVLSPKIWEINWPSFELIVNYNYEVYLLSPR